MIVWCAGYDACAHMSEETVGAQKSVPLAIIMSVFVSAVMGFVFLIALLVSIQVCACVSISLINWLMQPAWV